MKKYALPAFLIMTFSFALAYGQKNGPARNELAADRLGHRIEVIEATDITTSEAFFKAMSAARAPGGIVRVAGCDPDPVIQSWRPMTTTLRDMLDWVVRSDPQYGWQFDAGAINLIPKAGEPPLLATQIRSLREKDATSVEALLSRLHSLPEVRSKINELQLSEALRIMIAPVPLKQNQRRYSIDVKNVTVREALNSIARAHGSAVWEYKERRCDGKAEFSINFVIQ